MDKSCMLSSLHDGPNVTNGGSETSSSSNSVTLNVTPSTERRNSCYLEAKENVFRAPPKIHKEILTLSDKMKEAPKEVDLTR